jgi:hypothetical protein
MAKHRKSASHGAPAIERGTVDLENPATCVGCGCTDREGCEQGCTWLGVNRANATGVCSSCPDSLQEWEAKQS